ncbi:MAG: hypothetical protein ACYC7L_13420 [Nitrospirota bacterium]
MRSRGRSPGGKTVSLAFLQRRASYAIPFPIQEGLERVQFIQHKGRKILQLNFSDCASPEVLQIIEQAKHTIKTQSHRSVHTLTDVTNTAFNSAVSDAMKEFVLHNKPYVVASAVVGVTGLKQIIFNAVMKLSGRKLTAFESLDAAKDWLADHA